MNQSLFLGGKAFSNTTEWTSIWAVASCRLERNWFKMPTRSNCIHTEISAQWGICFTGMIMLVRWLYTKVYCSMLVCSFWCEKNLMDDLRATEPYMLNKLQFVWIYPQIFLFILHNFLTGELDGRCRKAILWSTTESAGIR